MLIQHFVERKPRLYKFGKNQKSHFKFYGSMVLDLATDPISNPLSAFLFSSKWV